MCRSKKTSGRKHLLDTFTNVMQMLCKGKQAGSLREEVQLGPGIPLKCASAVGPFRMIVIHC